MEIYKRVQKGLNNWSLDFFVELGLTKVGLLNDEHLWLGLGPYKKGTLDFFSQNAIRTPSGDLKQSSEEFRATGHSVVFYDFL